MAAALLMGFTSCDSDPSDSSTSAGGTAVKKMCGDWVVSVYTCDEPGDVANIDNWAWEELGAFEGFLFTYNTAANKATEMWIDDQGECYFGTGYDYSHKAKVNVQYGKRTFSSTEAENEYENGAVTIVGGKVLEGAATVAEDRDQVSHRDSIVYYVKVGDAALDYVKVSGYRNVY